MRGEPQLYKPAEACRIAEVAPYVLRYWETEFPALSEEKEKGPARLYSPRDVKIISRIRQLLYDEGFTVAGAKKRLDAEIAEGRFEDGLRTPASPVEQKKPAARNVQPALEILNPEFLGDAKPSSHTSQPKASARASAGDSFSERKRVVRELKEIVKLLERP